MSIIEENKELKMENVLSLRAKMTQPQIQQEMLEIGQVLQNNNLQKNGSAGLKEANDYIQELIKLQNL